ncbi:competence type IV pilus major pilin ComGC [Candidatus Formimonas warabiya]|uniref:Type II secretion system protein GspG C-terminal domain-containing protein n=1 Tax=Formimonas warabiya TaxID=1761012 RepID=A0A3G1KNJ4_FORW1|nr:prepilin-type N-terminal cleavage/methylation domain-containing protein [Candidatus Formimonas warabiya]ATW23990.1 hypothetical protein DCMF_03570 [Candidatus Formimonas warabiya]
MVLRILKKRINNERGFTLIELMVVLMILGILVSIAIPRFTNKIPEAQKVKTKADLTIIQNAVDLYYLDFGEYPTETSQLVEEGYLAKDPVKVNSEEHYTIDPDDGIVSE